MASPSAGVLDVDACEEVRGRPVPRSANGARRRESDYCVVRRRCRSGGAVEPPLMRGRGVPGPRCPPSTTRATTRVCRCSWHGECGLGRVCQSGSLPWRPSTGRPARAAFSGSRASSANPCVNLMVASPVSLIDPRLGGVHCRPYGRHVRSDRHGRRGLRHICLLGEPLTRRRRRPVRG